MLREFGIPIPVGAAKLRAAALAALEDGANDIPMAPKKFSSGNARRLGKLTRRGDIYLRQLLIHGGRSLLQSAALLRKQGKEIDRLADWALRLSARVGHNKAACAVANKLVRRLWAAEHHRRLHRASS